jgi:hypothetical protein
MTTRGWGAAVVALIASWTVPAVALATAPPESATMAEAVVATGTEATHLIEAFAAAGLPASAAEMQIAACEDSAQMHHPNATVRFENPYGRPVERDDVDSVVELLEADGWSSTESPRFDEGVDASDTESGYTVSASRGEHRIIFRVLTDGTRGWFDLLGACLDNTDHERELYLELGVWALPLPAAPGTATTAAESTVVP